MLIAGYLWLEGGAIFIEYHDPIKQKLNGLFVKLILFSQRSKTAHSKVELSLNFFSASKKYAASFLSALFEPHCVTFFFFFSVEKF